MAGNPRDRAFLPDQVNRLAEDFDFILLNQRIAHATMRERPHRSVVYRLADFREVVVLDHHLRDPLELPALLAMLVEDAQGVVSTRKMAVLRPCASHRAKVSRTFSSVK